MFFVLRFLVFVWMIVGINLIGFSQNQPNLLDLRDCKKNCSSNNYTIIDVTLTDQDGGSIISDLLTCTPGEVQTVYLTFEYITNSNSTVSNGRLLANLLVGDDEQFLNYFLDAIPPTPDGIPKFLTLADLPITWECGAMVVLEGPSLFWTTSGSKDLSESYACNDYPNSQCQYNNTIVVFEPLTAHFEHEAACLVDGTSTVTFQATGSGGVEPYAYEWEFTNGSIGTASIANPVVDFSAAGTAKVTVTDANGSVKTYETAIAIPVDYTLSALSTEQTDKEEPDGTITLEVDLAGTYTYEWSGSDGFSSVQKDLSGLEAGMYEVWVSDEFGCRQWMEVEVLLAAALPVKWGDITASTISGSGIIIQWSTNKEVQTSHFEIERSLTPLDGFEKIGSVEGKGWSNSVVDYIFADKDLTKNYESGWIYYRIKEVSLIGEVMYSDLIRVKGSKKPELTNKKWKLYPNPYESKQLWLQSSDGSKLNEQLKVNLISPNRHMEIEVSLVEGKAPVGEIFQGLSKGIYILRICSGAKCEHLKLIKH